MNKLLVYVLATLAALAIFAGGYYVAIKTNVLAPSVLVPISQVPSTNAPVAVSPQASDSVKAFVDKVIAYELNHFYKDKPKAERDEVQKTYIGPDLEYSYKSGCKISGGCGDTARGPICGTFDAVGDIRKIFPGQTIFILDPNGRAEDVVYYMPESILCKQYYKPAVNGISAFDRTCCAKVPKIDFPLDKDAEVQKMIQRYASAAKQMQSLIPNVEIAISRSKDGQFPYDYDNNTLNDFVDKMCISIDGLLDSDDSNAIKSAQTLLNNANSLYENWRENTLMERSATIMGSQGYVNQSNKMFADVTTHWDYSSETEGYIVRQSICFGYYIHEPKKLRPTVFE